MPCYLDRGAVCFLVGTMSAIWLSFSSWAADPVPTLIRAALSQHPALRAQSGVGEAAQAGVEGAKWQFWPTPSLGVEYANTNDPGYRGSDTVTTLRLQQPLWTGGRLTGNLGKSEAKVVSAQADLEATRQQLALRVIQAWSEASAAHNKLAAYQQSHDVHARLLGLVERRAREGASAQADVDLARSRLDTVDADLSAARAQRDTALNKLRLLTGGDITFDQLDAASRDLPPELEVALDALLAGARDQSPQIAKARAQAKIAEADIELAKSALSPEVYLRAERQYGSFSVPGQDPQNRFFIGLTTNLGGGLSSLSGLDAARALHRAALEDIQTQQLVVDEQVQSDAILVRTAGDRRQNLERARQSAIDVSASWERQFLAGRKQWQDLMNAAREQTQTDVQLADALGAQQVAGWRLAVLVQGVAAALELKSRPQAPLPAIPISPLTTRKVGGVGALSRADSTAPQEGIQ